MKSPYHVLPIHSVEPGTRVARVRREHEEALTLDSPALEALSIADLRAVHVGDVIATLREAGRQHAIVLEEEERRAPPAVRGLFSATHIGALGGAALLRVAGLPVAPVAAAMAPRRATRS